MSTTESTSDALTLMWSKKGDTVTVTPANEDRYAIKYNKLVAILKLAEQTERFGGQLDFLIKILADWISEQHDCKDAFLTHNEDGLTFVAVHHGVSYNPDFDDALSDLDHKIANDPDLDMVRLSTISLPPVDGSALAQFLNKNFTLVFDHGE